MLELTFTRFPGYVTRRHASITVAFINIQQIRFIPFDFVFPLIAYRHSLTKYYSLTHSLDNYFRLANYNLAVLHFLRTTKRFTSLRTALNLSNTCSNLSIPLKRVRSQPKESMLAQYIRFRRVSGQIDS